jgi:hypothetical protein
MKTVLANQNHLFWEALVISLFIFGCGILLGYFVENGRTERLDTLYADTEVTLIDTQNQMALLGSDIDCNLSIRKNIEFGDRIYSEALLLEKYEQASQLSESLANQQKKFSTLRVSFFLNSIKIRERCNSSFDIITYFYEYDSDSLKQEAKQNIFSDTLLSLKQKLGNEIILIPIAMDLNISSVDILKENYNITKAAVLLNKEKVFDSLEELNNLSSYLS